MARHELYGRARRDPRAPLPPRLEFQAVSWYAEDAGDAEGGADGGKDGGAAPERQYTVKVFGVDAVGASVSVTLRGFTPFFYVKVEDAWLRTPGMQRAVESALRREGARHQLRDVRAVGKKDFWGFTHGAVSTFLRLSFGTLRGMRVMASSLRRAPLRVLGRALALRLYESNVDPLLRLFHIRGLAPAGWLAVERAHEVDPACPMRSTCEVDAEADWTRVSPLQRDEPAPLLVAAFDIECNSSHGDFPVASKDYRRLAIDLQELHERGGAKALARYEACEALADAMRDAFGLARRGPEPPAGAPRPARLVLKRRRRAAGDAARLEHAIVSNLDDVYGALRGGPAQRAAAAAPDGEDSDDDAGGGAGGGDSGGGGGGAGGNPALDATLGVLNRVFQREWPLAGDEVIQIGTTVAVYGRAPPGAADPCAARHVFVLGGCAPVEGAVVHAFATEADMLLAWVDFVRALDPDVVTGYNILGFDMAYMHARARELLGGGDDGVVPGFSRLGRLEDVYSRYVEQRLSSSALGDNVLRYLDLQGRVTIDLMKVVQRDHRLGSYKLDAVAEHFTGQRKQDVSPADIFRLQRGSDADRAVIAAYCVQDCALCNVLAAKLEVLANNTGMANVCSVPLSFIFMRGQGVKIFSLVARQCRADGFVIPARDRDEAAAAGAGDGYEGAIVLEPHEGLYLEDPVSVLDYASLYPSSMISENLSHDSLVLDPAFADVPGVEYVDVTYDAVGAGGGAEPVTCRFAQVGADGRSPGRAVLPRILEALLRARKATRRRMAHVRVSAGARGELVGALDAEAGVLHVGGGEGGVVTVTPEQAAAARPAWSAFQAAVLDGLQNAYKVTANSLYGQMGSRTSPLYLKHVAACTTAVGRQMILKARDFMERELGARVVYGDSVAAGTPVLVRRRDGTVDVLPVEALAGAAARWAHARGGKEQCSAPAGASEVWGAGGWAALLRVVRHRAGKRMFAVHTARGWVEVTEDHSLVAEAPGGGEVCALATPDGLLAAPGTRLVHVHPPAAALQPPAGARTAGLAPRGSGAAGPVPTAVLNASDAAARRAYLDAAAPGGIAPGLSPLRAQGLYVLAASLGLAPRVEAAGDGGLSLDLGGPAGGDALPALAVSELHGRGPEEYVYDLETSSGVFHAGVGCLLLKNTDSIFCVFRNVDGATGARLSGRAALAASIAMGQEASRRFRPLLRPPHDLEYEKTFFPFVLLSKKRYVGLVYEADADAEGKQKSMGIVLKRRDNAPVVKRAYGGLLDILLRERNVPAAAAFVADTLRDLVEGRVDLAELVVSKTLRSFYKDPTRIAHNVLAQRMGDRDPGNRPQSNDRIPYVYVEPPAGKRGATVLQGDRIEHPDYVRRHGLTPDYRHYITNQIMRPVLQVFALPRVLEQLPGYAANPRLSGPRALQALLPDYGGDAKKARDRLGALREREVERLLFAPVLAHAVFRAADNRRNRQREITSFFGPRD